MPQKIEVKRIERETLEGVPKESLIKYFLELQELLFSALGSIDGTTSFLRGLREKK